MSAMTEYTVAPSHLLALEHEILRVLQWRLSPVTVVDWVGLYLKAYSEHSRCQPPLLADSPCETLNLALYFQTMQVRRAAPFGATIAGLRMAWVRVLWDPGCLLAHSPRLRAQTVDLASLDDVARLFRADMLAASALHVCTRLLCVPLDVFTLTGASLCPSPCGMVGPRTSPTPAGSGSLCRLAPG
jgi:hypothetical protein